MTDEQGGQCRMYMVDYPYQGSKYCVDVYATSWEDAEARLNAIKGWGKIAGEVHEVVPALTGMGWLSRLYVRLRVWWLSK